jgi:hypothetical protein
MRILIFGESHTAALFVGHKQLRKGRATLPDIAIRSMGGGHAFQQQFFADRGDHVAITAPELSRQIDRLPLPGLEAVYGFCAPLCPYRLYNKPAWQMPISKPFLRPMVIEDQKQALAFIDALKQAGIRLFVIEAPRPFRHHHALKKTHSAVISYVDRMYRDIIRDELAKRDVPVVSVPVHLFDAEGFMLEEYACPDDPYHGNARFGRVMIEEIAAFVSKDPLGSAGMQLAAA